jgi:transposase
MGIRVREMTSEESQAIERLARARNEPASRVARAKMVAMSQQGLSVPAIAKQLGLGEKRVRDWVRRFNAQGLAGLEDKPRSGRPARYTLEQVGVVLEIALSKPQSLGLAFGSWTLDRLSAYLNEVKGIPSKRSRVDELLIREGLRWRKEETWFGQRLDPEFAQKRGPFVSSTRRRQRVV